MSGQNERRKIIQMDKKVDELTDFVLIVSVILAMTILCFTFTDSIYSNRNPPFEIEQIIYCFHFLLCVLVCVVFIHSPPLFCPSD